ncbi:MAG: hypothetical protein C4288_02760 [Leptolyngbya sp. ERB_1_1]
MFTVRFPIALSQTETETTLDQPESNCSLAGTKILVVDDENPTTLIFWYFCLKRQARSYKALKLQNYRWQNYLSLRQMC